MRSHYVKPAHVAANRYALVRWVLEVASFGDVRVIAAACVGAGVR